MNVHGHNTLWQLLLYTLRPQGEQKGWKNAKAGDIKWLW